MASHSSNNFLVSSDDDEVFIGFTVEEVARIWEQHERRWEQVSVSNANETVYESMDLAAQEIENNSDVKLFVNEAENEIESSDNESSDD